MHSYNVPKDYTVTNESSVLEEFVGNNSIKKSLFLINRGASGTVTFTIQGGIVSSDNFNPDPGAPWTDGHKGLLYRNIVVQTVPAGENRYVDLSDYVYNWIKVTAVNTVASSTVNMALQETLFQS